MAQRGTTAEIDLGELEKLASMMCTDEEIGNWFGVDVRTIERRKKDPKFADALQHGRAKGRVSLRRAQLKLIEEGSAAMAIFWGKNYLSQSDLIRHDINNTGVMLQLVLPRNTDIASLGLDGRGANANQPLEIAPADYEKVTEDE